DGLRSGRSGVQRIDFYDVSAFPVQIAGICSDFELSQLPDPQAARYLHRGERFGVAAAAEALRDAGCEPGTYAPEETGVALGGSVDRPALQEFSDVFAVRSESEGHKLHRFPPLQTLRNSQNTACLETARLAGAGGPMIGVSTACTASAHSIGEAYRLIQDGEASMMVAGGFDALTSWC